MDHGRIAVAGPAAEVMQRLQAGPNGGGAPRRAAPAATAREGA